MSQGSKITLRYKRHQDLVDDEHLFTGKFLLVEKPGDKTVEQPFLGLKFHQMMTAASRLLREWPDAVLYMERTERPGLKPIKLEEDMRVLLRDDPVRGIESMTVRPGAKVRAEEEATAKPSPYDHLAEVFDDEVYLRMKNGGIEDPATGRWASLAAFVKTGEWAVRGENDKSETWLKVRLPELGGRPVNLHNAAEAGSTLASCKWAAVKVKDILKQPGNKFFLPRAWNTHGQWIGRRELQQLLEEIEQIKEGEKS